MTHLTNPTTTRPVLDDDFWARREILLEKMAAEEAAAKAAEAMARQRARWMQVPKEYRQPLDVEHSGFHVPADIVAYCQAWTPKMELGIGIMGDPGCGKTRLLVDILRRLKCDFYFLPCWRFSELVKEAAYNDRSVARDAQRDLRTARTCSVLLLDDIGDIKPSPAVVQEFKALTDYRCHRGLPVLWNGNPDQEALAAQYGDSDAMLVQMQASVRRLVDFSWMPGDTAASTEQMSFKLE